MDIMKLTEHTKFLFIAVSSKQNESQADIDRFSTDISLVVRVLEKKGVLRTDMEIVSDWKDADWNNQNIGDIIRIAPQDAYNHIQNTDCDNLFIISSCHGGLDGIGENGLIRPHNLIEAIKGNVHLQNCVALFGQCHAGVFHYSNLVAPPKNIVYIGAAGLRSGISTGMRFTSPPDIDVTWSANVFVYFLAKWFDTPKDVDNDGNYSVMDLYKSVTDQTNAVTEFLEKRDTKQYLETKVKIEYKKQQINGPLDLQTQLEEQANEKLLESIYSHQDCWILNAVAASLMIIEF